MFGLSANMSVVSKRRQRRLIQVLLFLFLLIIFLECRSYLTSYYPRHPVEVQVPPGDKYVTTYSSHWKPQTVKKMLFWTPFFGSWQWSEDAKLVLANCSFKCEVTNDKSQIEDVNALVFHANDIWTLSGFFGTILNPLIKLPSYRDPNQVWVMWSMEPMCYMWGKVPSHMFNWTVLYRRDSTIPMPFSAFVKGFSNTEIIKNEEELKIPIKQNHAVNYWAEKSKMAVIQVSNCKDQARRYKVINELAKFIDVDEFGSCSGNMICKHGIPTVICGQRYFKPYKFYLAFENTFCRDYLSEKFWNALERHQIPVIAATKVTLETAPPNSYLNVYDFPSVKHLADRMLEIAGNATLFNSFFEWENTYVHDPVHPYCKLCQRLHEDHPAQSYHDMEGWLKDDSCSKPTVSTTYYRQKKIKNSLKQNFQKLCF